MATNNAVNTSLSGQTGTGNFVGALSPSLTNPNMNAIYNSGNLEVVFGAAASPVNYLQITNAATGSPVSLTSQGTDTNIPLYLAGKGTTQIRLGNDLLMYNTSGGNNYTQFTVTASGAQAVTIPNLSGTMAISGAGQNVNFSIVQLSSIYAPNGTGLINPNGVTNAVNYWTISNNATGQPVYMASAGSDTDIGQYFITKGNAGIVLQTAATSASPLSIQSGTSSQHTTAFVFSNTAATRTVTFPDLTGTVQLASNTGTTGQVLTSNGTGVAPSYQNAAGGTDAAFGFLLMGG